jgi:hypothetical protein
MNQHIILLDGDLGCRVQFEQLTKASSKYFQGHSSKFMVHGVDKIPERMSMIDFTKQLHYYI